MLSVIGLLMFHMRNLIYTFLGPNTFEYLSLSSMEGFPKLQPHEASRVEWINLLQINSQVRLDAELRTLGTLDGERAKDLVAAAWGLAALMAFMSPSVFLTEADDHVSSVRQGAITISSGKGVRIIPAFKPSSLVDSLDFLAYSINDPIYEAVDLMWIALAMTEVEKINVPHGTELPSEKRRYSVFLSHRGLDSKADLLSRLLNDGFFGSIFLDCLHPAVGCVNRLFVFGSLVNSTVSYVVQSPNFSESTWCLKEKRLAEYLSITKRADCYIFNTVGEAWAHLTNHKSPRVQDAEVSYNASVKDPSLGPLFFIGPDFNGKDRAPNRKTLSKYPEFIAAVDRIISHLGEGDWRDNLKIRLVAGKYQLCNTETF